jgi:long-chain acyl-CoA synthetase
MQAGESDATDGGEMAHRWLKLYPTSVPAEVTAKQPDMLRVFADAVAHAPDAPVMVYFDRTISFAQLDAESDALAVWLTAKGIGKGDRIVIIVQNIPAFAQMALAAWKVGAVPVPCNPMYRASELARLYADSEPRLVLCEESSAAESVEAIALAGLKDCALLVATPGHGLAEQPSVLPRSCPDVAGDRIDDVIERHLGQKPAPIRLSPEDLGLILYTSGTTGVPKGAMITHGNIAFSSEVIRNWCDLGADDGILAIAPLFHITGFICHLGASFTAGSPMVMSYRFEVGTILDAVRTHRPTFIIGAITAFNALQNHPEVKPEDVASLTKAYSGGAPIPPALRGSIRQSLGLIIHPCYGMTETTSPAIFTPLGSEPPFRDDAMAIGVPVPSTEVIIVDEQGQPCPIGEPGEVLMRGPQIMQGYWRQPEATAEALESGWMHSGDVGFTDEDGWFYLVDRKKDCIIASGFKVWPREVEDVLYAHPSVREAAVIGVPDEYRGENVKACVSLIEGTSAEADELATWCRERLAAYKVPRIVEIMADLPKTITGKIRRAELREGTKN